MSPGSSDQRASKHGVIHLANPAGGSICGTFGPGDTTTRMGSPTCPRCKGKGVAGRVISQPAVFFGCKKR
jgi:hypothetical protein